MNITSSYNPINSLGIGTSNPINYSPIKINDAVLHLGCGTGDDTFAICRIVGSSGRVIGIDYDISNIATSRQSCGNFGYNNATFFVRDIEKLIFEDANFDVIICNYAINLMPNRDNILDEINRVLKKDGKLVISDFLINKTLPADLNNTISKKYYQITKLQFNNFPQILEKKEYINLLNAHNFSDIRINVERNISIDDGELLLYIDNDYFAEWNKIEAELNKIVTISNKS